MIWTEVRYLWSHSPNFGQSVQRTCWKCWEPEIRLFAVKRVQRGAAETNPEFTLPLEASSLVQLGAADALCQCLARCPVLCLGSPHATLRRPIDQSHFFFVINKMKANWCSQYPTSIGHCFSFLTGTDHVKTCSDTGWVLGGFQNGYTL